MQNTRILGELTFLTAELCGVHRLTEHLDGHAAGFLQGAVLLIVLLQETLRAGIVGGDIGLEVWALGLGP